MEGENLNHPTWRICRAETSNIDAMLNLWSYIPEIQSSIADSFESVQGFMELNQASFLVALLDVKLIGTVMGGYNGWRGTIYHLAVHPDYRGQGIGRALLEQCIAVLHQRGAPRVDLYTYASNETAQAFYRKLGWRERKEVKNFSWEYSQNLKLPGDKG
ncbi:MAG: N-acetyltransferase [Firmicutes bacterium HGW-Firmicutes-15]|nr:MAG: N-acetyltransferase [Firmicutes bacterium HGW-Firmicutes-15]